MVRVYCRPGPPGPPDPPGTHTLDGIFPDHCIARHCLTRSPVHSPTPFGNLQVLQNKHDLTCRLFIKLGDPGPSAPPPLVNVGPAQGQGASANIHLGAFGHCTVYTGANQGKSGVAENLVLTYSLTHTKVSSSPLDV